MVATFCNGLVRKLSIGIFLVALSKLKNSIANYNIVLKCEFVDNKYQIIERDLLSVIRKLFNTDDNIPMLV